MGTFLRFSRNIRKHGSNIENNSVMLTRRVSKVALRSLVKGTPVDEGVARSNWRVSIGNPTRAVISAYAPGKKLGIDETSNANAAISAGISVINRLRVGSIARGSSMAGNALYITNSVSYLDKLRSGSSGQQGSDWVAAALQEAASEIRMVRLISSIVKDE